MDELLTYFYRDGTPDDIPPLMDWMDRVCTDNPSARKTMVGFFAGLKSTGLGTPNRAGLPFTPERVKAETLDIATFEIKKPAHLDWCWAHFMASGDLTGPRRVLRAALHGRGLIKKLACWSLASNAAQHDPVLVMVGEAVETEPPGRGKSWLTEVVTDAAGAAQRARGHMTSGR